MDQLKNRGLEIPLIQGGMGVGVSLSGLAGAVAKTGAMGCISTADCGYREEDFRRFPEEANLRALRKEIQRAKVLSEGKGMIAINAMVATRQWEDAIKVAVEEGIDAVISGAGLPLRLPELVPADELPRFCYRPGAKNTKQPRILWYWKGLWQGDIWALRRKRWKRRRQSLWRN